VAKTGQVSTAKVDWRAAARLRKGHVWVYRSDLLKAPPADPGSLVLLEDERGKRLGTALYSSASVIALRLISSDAVTEEKLPALVRARLEAARAYREQVVRESDAFRVVFSEADALPGLIIDRYNDVVAFQVLTQAWDRAGLRGVVLDWMADALKPRAIVERVDARIRQLEKLPPREGGVVWPNSPAAAAGAPPRTVFHMNNLAFEYVAGEGQKTGAFLDQRENYAAAERHSRGEALDVFCYQGGFALHLGRRCEHVTAVDSSRPALEAAERNEKLNAGALRVKEMEWIEANAFDLLKDYARAGKSYDTIVLDPPAFARNLKSVPRALRGYKEINLRALKMLRPGGVLVTCSCSHHVSESDFLHMLTSAAEDARRRVCLLEHRGAAPDHPSILQVPETSYLKCVVVAVSR